MESQSFCLRARKIRAVVDTHQDLIGHDAPVMSRILPDHNEHSAFKGQGKEDVTSKVSVTTLSHGYGDATMTYIRRVKILSRIYAKPQYRKYIYDPQQVQHK